MKPGKLRTIALLVAASALLGTGTAYAAVQTVTASIKFLTDLTFTTVASPNFGYVKAATVGTYVLSTAGAVTGGVTEGGTTAAGNYTITGSGTQLIDISAGNYVAVGASTPSLAVCKYNGVAQDAANCTFTTNGTAPGAGKTLLVGLTVVTTAAGADNQTDTPHFDLTVVYQ